MMRKGCFLLHQQRGGASSSGIVPPERLSKDGRFTNIIVGGGTAGCLLANRLSADPKRTVLLIEAGETRDNHPFVSVPAGYLKCIGNPLTDWMYSTTEQPGLNGRKLKYPRGKMLGGCSSINGMLYLRGQSRDYDQWAYHCDDESWSWKHCLPYFKRHERHWRLSGNDGKGGLESEQADIQVATEEAQRQQQEHQVENAELSPNQVGAAGHFRSQLHSGEGELHVVKQRLRWKLLDVIQDAVVEVFGKKALEERSSGSGNDNELSLQTKKKKLLHVGPDKSPEKYAMEQVEDFNGGSNAGVGYFEVHQKEGTRWNSSRAFLPSEVKNRSNLHVLSNATVQNLILEKDSETGKLYCTGVRISRQGKIEKLLVSRSLEETMEDFQAEAAGGERVLPPSEDDPDYVVPGEVILSAGSIGSAQILQLSGVGPAELLESAGVTPLHNLPVGLNLQDHLQLRTIFQLDARGGGGDADGEAAPTPLVTMNSIYHNWLKLIQVGLEYLTNKSGPLTMAPSQLGCFLHSDLGKPAAVSRIVTRRRLELEDDDLFPADAERRDQAEAERETDAAFQASVATGMEEENERADTVSDRVPPKIDPETGKVFPNLEYHIQPLSLDAFGKPLHEFDAFTLSICNLNPTSRGYVMIKNNSPTSAPEINPNYLFTEEDKVVAANAIRTARAIALGSSCLGKKYKVQEYLPGAHLQSTEKLIEGAGNIGTTIFHPVGTCAMGPEPQQLNNRRRKTTGEEEAEEEEKNLKEEEESDAEKALQEMEHTSVVSPRLKVHGIAGLRVADASVMPFITSGNTNAPTLMIAERAAEWILQESGGAHRVGLK